MKPSPCTLAAFVLFPSIAGVPAAWTFCQDGAAQRVSTYGGVADASLLLPGARTVPDPNTPEVCRARRRALAAKIGDGIFMIQAGKEGDGRFQADDDFHYLTGLDRPDARLLLVVEEGQLVLDELYLPEQTAQQRLWEGPKLNPSDLAESSSFDRVLDATTFDFAALAERAKATGVLAIDEKTLAELVEHDIDAKRGRTPLNALQVIKSAEEIAALETAVDITMAALADAIVVAVPGAWEFQAEAAVEGGFRRRGAEFLAFPSICGSGANSCYLHYRANNRQMKDGDLLLMDVGAKYHGYSADFTRTIPVNGKFTERQREIYTLVYEAQQTAVAALKPGVSMRDVHNVAVAFFEKAGYREYFKHGLGHQLGIRVHDVPGFRGELAPGMVVTVEPGLYLIEEEIGVRIEDDYLITEDGSRKLSDAIPSAPDELEAYIARLRSR